MQSCPETVKRLPLLWVVLTGKTLLSLFPGIASGVVTGARGVCVWSVWEEYNTIQLLLDLSAHCLQPVTACHINEVAHKSIHFISAHNVCVQVQNKKTSLNESAIRENNIFSIVQSCFCVPVWKQDKRGRDKQGKGWDGDWDGWMKCLCVNMHPVCLIHITLYSIFQPAAAKLNSAFLLTVNDIGDHRQLGWLAAWYGRICIGNSERKKRRLERQKYRWKVTFMSHKRSANQKLHEDAIISISASKSFSHFVVDYLFLLHRHAGRALWSVSRYVQRRYSSWFCLIKATGMADTLFKIWF